MEKKVPQRRCTGCMESFDKGALIKIVKTPVGEVVVDTSGKQAGRSAYICKNKSCIEKALKGGRLKRALKCEVLPEITEYLERQAKMYE